MATLPEYTLEQVAQHKTREDAWIVVEGWVLDVSEFWSLHPGGPDVLFPWLGRDATAIFHSPVSHAHSEASHHLVAQFRIGVLQGAMSAADVTRAIQARPGTAEDYGIDTKRGLIWQAALLGEKYPSFLHDVLFAQGGLRYFDNSVLEALTRSPWWTVPLIWVPIMTFLLMCAHFWAPNASLLSLATLWLFAGPLAWTFIEYGLHRGVFHINTSTFYWNYMHMLLHGYHHVCPMDPDRLTFPPVPAMLIALPIFAACISLLGWGHGSAFMAGIILGYMAYDLTHYWLHHAAPKSLPRTHRALKTHHLYHHFSNPESNFGLSSSLADWVFGSFDTDERASKA